MFQGSGFRGVVSGLMSFMTIAVFPKTEHPKPVT